MQNNMLRLQYAFTSFIICPAYTCIATTLIDKGNIGKK